MKMSIILKPLLLSLLTIELFLTGCTSKDSQVADHLASGTAAFESGDWATAEIEYLNAIKIDNTSVAAFAKLGTIFFDQGRPRQAFQMLNRANQLDPENLEISYRLAMTYLNGGDQEAAGAEALLILEKDPSNPHGPIILANSAINREEYDEITETLDDFKLRAPDNASYAVARGLLLARFGRIDEGKLALSQALEIDPESRYANSALASFYSQEGDSENAEAALLLAAKDSPIRSTYRLQLTQLYLQGLDKEKGEGLLNEILESAPNYVPALTMKARLQGAAQDTADTRETVDHILSLDPLNHDGRIMHGALLTSEGKTQEAVDHFVETVKLFPNSPVALYNLGRAYFSNNDPESAIASLEQCLRLNPDDADATSLISQIQLRSGDFSAGVANTEKLMETNPDNPNLKLQLAAGYRGQKRYDEAIAIYEELEKSYPADAQISLLKGQSYMQKNDPEKAIAAFEEALKRDPNHVVAFELLTNYYLSQKRFAYALEQISIRKAAQPQNAGWYMIEAKVHMAQGDTAKAEAELLKAIELQPDNRNSYVMLTQVYLQSKNRDSALSRLKEMVSKNPRDVPALMVMSGIYKFKKEWENARYTYEKILDADPDFGPAQNNLAYLYSTHLDDLEKAHDLANKARQKYPQDGAIADTLGWIKYRQGDYEWAQTLLQESIEKIPGNAEILYHLGSTYYMLGNEEEARDAFEKALASAPEFLGREVVEQRLAHLKIDPSAGGSNLLAQLEKLSSEDSSDPVILNKLATVYSSTGKVSDALKAYNSVLAANPKNLPALMGKANLLAGGDDGDQALEAARNAYKQATNNPELSSQIGRIAYLSGDHAWSANLLQEAARRIDNNPDLNFHLAESLLATGRLSNAQDALSQASGPKANALSAFIELASLSVAQSIDLEKARQLAHDSGNALAPLWVAALSSPDEVAATKSYQALLDAFPEFTPAKRSLAILYAPNQSVDEDDAYRLASEAARVYSNDTELQRATGLILFRQENFSRAASLLKDNGAAHSEDAYTQFALGISLHESGKAEEGTAPLKRALELGLSGADADTAKAAISD